jgi:hypothetical protein
VTKERDRGQSTVELAIALPVVVVLVLVVVQSALVVRDHLLVVHAAREAVRAASVASVDRHVAALGGAQRAGPLDADRLRLSEEVLPGGDRLRVHVEYPSPTDLPLIGALLPDVVLSTDAVMRIEAVERSPG